MNFLFHHRTKKILHYVWVAVAIIVSLGMVFFFAPGLITYLAG